MKRLLLLLLFPLLSYGYIVTITDTDDCRFSPKGSYSLPSTGKWVRAYYKDPSYGSVTINGIAQSYKESLHYFIPNLSTNVTVTFEKGKSPYLPCAFRSVTYACTSAWQTVRFCAPADYPQGSTDLLFPYDADSYLLQAVGGSVEVCETNQFSVVVPTMYGSKSLTLSPFTIPSGGTLKIGRSLPLVMFRGTGSISITGVKNE